MATKPRGGGRLKALVAGPLLKRTFICDFPKEVAYSDEIIIGDRFATISKKRSEGGGGGDLHGREGGGHDQILIFCVIFFICMY